jgi:hypothetical protein
MIVEVDLFVDLQMVHYYSMIAIVMLVVVVDEDDFDYLHLLIN